MSNPVLQTYLAERLQSAKGLGWVLPEEPATEPAPTESLDAESQQPLPVAPHITSLLA